ncbi:MAG: NAD(P)H-hydrate dehydratase [Polyangiales bacterium]
MIPLLTRDEVRALDARAIEGGVAGLVLMENAGRGAAEAILTRFAGALDHVVCVGGPGQNGGDAWVIARHLACAGVDVRGVLVGDATKVRGDARPNLDALAHVGVPWIACAANEVSLEGATLLVDGLFGTGLDRPIEGALAELVRRLDAHPAPVVALDLPSGIDASTGAVLGVAPHAALTVTFAAHKRGLWQYPARRHVGEVVLASIGVPAPTASRAELVEDADVATLLKRRDADSHKGRAGHVLVIAGAPGKTGAALLAGHGALRGGTGLVTIGTRAPDALDAKVVELMSTLVDGEEAARDAMRGKHAAVLGPGLGLDDSTRSWVGALAISAPLPMALDADALTALAGELATLQAAPPRVLTPHPAEAARLLGIATEVVQHDRYAAATTLATQSGQVAILKGAGSVIAAPDGRLRVVSAGTPALGVAGTGDVLAGLVGALLAEGLDAFDAAWAAAHLHARAGELAAGGRDRGLLAREVADALPTALETLRG